MAEALVGGILTKTNGPHTKTGVHPGFFFLPGIYLLLAFFFERECKFAHFCLKAASLNFGSDQSEKRKEKVHNDIRAEEESNFASTSECDRLVV